MNKCLSTLMAALVFLISQHALCGTYGGGSGTAAEPYIIATAEQMQEVGANSTDWDKYFILTADIDLAAYTGMSYNIIGNVSTAFTGVFDGAGHVISNLTIDTSGGTIARLGLFGIVGTPNGSIGEIKNLGVVNIDIIAASQSSKVGGVVAMSYCSSISNCYVTGEIRGGSNVGSLAGYIHESAISNCYANCKVSSYEDVGGLVGRTYESTIDNCYATGSINGTYDVGGLVGSGSSGNISDCYATGKVTGGSRIGGLAGNSCSLENCYATGRVTAYGSSVGGLVGYSPSPVTNCYATGSVYGNSSVGGLAGSINASGFLTYCSAVGSVYGNNSVGGLVGKKSDCAISNCSALGNVNGVSNVGGLVGRDSGNYTTNCYAVGNVSGGEYVGGLIGRIYELYSSSLFTDCYASGSVNGDEYVGGLVGDSLNGSYYYTFWNSEVNPGISGIGNIASHIRVFAKTTLELQTESTFTDYGWDFVGESTNGDEDIWKMPGCGCPVLSWQSLGIVPDVVGLLETDAMLAITSAGILAGIEKKHSQIIPLGQVISQEPSVGCESTAVTLIVSDGFPYEAGSGTEVDPYRVRTAEHMNSIGVHSEDWHKNFVLMADIDLSTYTETSYNIIGRDSFNSFTGVFDGNSHIVSNFTFTSSGLDNIGLFGYLGFTGQVRNLGLQNVNIDAGTGVSVGGLAGYVSYYGTIENCYAEGSVSGGSFSVGGLVGINHGSMTDCDAVCTVNGNGGLVGDNAGTLTNCSASGTVNANEFDAGGLAGSNGGRITNCYATSSVMGPWDGGAGGLVGSNGGSITGCYAAGDIIGRLAGGLVGSNENGSLTNCYFSGSVGASFDGGITGYDQNGSYDSCFWDSEVNSYCVGVENIDDPAGVMGRTTLEMQTQSTYTDHGWDFVGEDVNGVEDIWRLCVDGVGYPRFSWEHDSVGDFECPDGTAGEDLGYFLEHWLSSDGRADLNGDGVVTLFDFALFAGHWMEGV